MEQKKSRFQQRMDDYYQKSHNGISSDGFSRNSSFGTKDDDGYGEAIKKIIDDFDKKKAEQKQQELVELRTQCVKFASSLPNHTAQEMLDAADKIYNYITQVK